MFALLQRVANWLATRSLRRRARHVGDVLFVHATAIVKSPGNIVLGRDVEIGEFSILDGRGERDAPPSITIGDHVRIKAKAYIAANGGKITVGAYSMIGHGTWLGGQSDITIGENSLIGTNTVIVSSNHDYRHIAVPFYDVPELRAPVLIGNNVWIGANCVILPGSAIGANSVIAAGAVVRGEVPAGSLVKGFLASITPASTRE